VARHQCNNKAYRLWLLHESQCAYCLDFALHRRVLHALICAAFSVIVTARELRAGAWRPALKTVLDIALALPKISLRWQQNYFQGALVIALIALAFPNHIGF